MSKIDVVVREVGLRDGLQSLARTLPTAQKLQWIQAAYDAGVREIEVGSFVPPKLLPQLADTHDLVTFAKTLPGLCVTVLVPNLKGAERAMDCGANWTVGPMGCCCRFLPAMPTAWPICAKPLTRCWLTLRRWSRRAG